MIRQIRSILAAAFALATLASVFRHRAGNHSVRSERPTLKAEATVTGDIVRIGDLVEHAGIIAKVPIFRAPDLGFTGTVPADAVVEAVRSHALVGLDTAGLREVVVTRARAPSPPRTSRSIARALAVQFNLGKPSDITVTFERDMQAMYVEPSAKATRVAH